MPSLDPYKVLQVDREAEIDAIDAAYRRLAAKCHPDKDHSPSANTRMKAINAAYEILKDPEKRAAYGRGIEGARVQRDQRDTKSRTTDQVVPSSAGTTDSSQAFPARNSTATLIAAIAAAALLAGVVPFVRDWQARRAESEARARQAAIVWTKYAPPDESFHVELPGVPEEIHEADNTAPSAHKAGPMLPFRGVDLLSAGVYYSVVWADYDVVDIDARATFLKEARDNTVRKLDGLLLVDRELVAGPVPGREVGISIKDGKLSCRARFLLDRKRLYKLAALVPSGTPGGAFESTTRFLDSFELRPSDGLPR
jgi:hypothetical protein